MYLTSVRVLVVLTRVISQWLLQCETTSIMTDVIGQASLLSQTLRALNSVRSVREVVSLGHGFMFVS